MIYTGLLSLLLAEYAANQKCSAVLLCSADSIYPWFSGVRRMSEVNTRWARLVYTLMGDRLRAGIHLGM